MFVPLLLVGGALGNAYAQSVVHAPTHDLYAAVGMAAFIAAGYKAPLTAVVFVAETDRRPFVHHPEASSAPRLRMQSRARRRSPATSEFMRWSNSRNYRDWQCAT